MRFNICVGAVKGGLFGERKKKIRVYVCVDAVQGSYAKRKKPLRFFENKTC